MRIKSAGQVPATRRALTNSGHTVVETRTPATAGLRETQAAIARTLKLPPTAGRNLDALVDSLRDVPTIWHGHPVALLWHDADRLAAADGHAWWQLAEILDAAGVTIVALRGHSNDAPRR